MVATVNSAATLIASPYEAARSSRVRAPLLIHYPYFRARPEATLGMLGNWAD